MDADMLTVARKLADGGHLPGIEWSDSFHSLISGSSPNMVTLATEAGLHLACHNAIVDPKRQWHLRYVHNESGGFTEVHYGQHETHRARSPGHTTLSLLTAFAAALEAK